MDAIARAKFRGGGGLLSVQEFVEETVRETISALADPQHRRHNALRLHFDGSVRYAMRDVYRRFEIRFGRYEGVEDIDGLEQQAEQSPSDEAADLIRKIDRQEAFRRLRHILQIDERLNIVFELTLSGKTQEEIAAKIGRTVRQVRRLQEKILEILSDPDTE